MSSKYEYLKKYINLDNPDREISTSFFPITEEEVIEAEKRLGFRFPEQLRNFYMEIGYGFFESNHDRSVIQKDWPNRLLDPASLVDIKLLGYDSGQITSDVEFAEEDLPFFEIANGNSFFCLKPQSAHPNRVYDADDVVAESLEEFIWKLYYVSPIYYFDLDFYD